MVKYEERKPTQKLLQPFIESFVQVSGEKQISKNIPPQPGKVIVLDFNKSTLYNKRSLKTVVVGHHEQAFQLNAKHSFNDKLLIRLSPYGLSAFLKVPVHELNNRFVNGEDLFGPEINALYDALQPVISIDKRITEVEKFFVTKYAEPTPAHKMIFRLADFIRNTRDLPSLTTLKNKIPLSVRHVEKTFRKLTGTDISEFRKLSRFENARQQVLRNSYSSLTAVAHDTGYYDQPHFNSDFKLLVGTTPKRYRFCE